MENKSIQLHHVDYYSLSGDTKKDCVLLIEDGKIKEILENGMGLSSRDEIIDCSNLYLVPGFIDSHLHIPGDYLYRDYGVFLGDELTLEGYLNIINQKKTHPVIRGYGWNNNNLNKYPNQEGYKRIKKVLDEQYPDRMAILYSDDYHSAICNDVLIKNYIERRGKDRDSEKKKCLYQEEDIFLIQDLIPEISFSSLEIENAILSYQDMLLRNGITSVQSLMFLGGDGEKEWRILQRLDRENRLHLNVNLAMNVYPLESLEKIYDKFQKWKSYESNRIQVNTVKIYIDGVVENQTALLMEPYENSTLRGDSIWEAKNLEELCIYLDRQNIQIHAHAIGDAAVGMITNALCNAMDKNHTKNKRKHTITHLQLASDDDIQKMGEYGIIACIQPYWFPMDHIYYPIDELQLGSRVEEEYKARTFMDYSVLITASSDSPVTRYPNPILGISCGRYRHSIREQVGIYEMLDAFTKNGAYQLGREEHIGEIREGYVADLVLLSNPIQNTDRKELEETKVIMTIKEGVIRYRKE